MKSKTFLVLLAVCAALALAAFLMFQKPDEAADTESTAFLADLPVNDLTALTLTGPESEVVLEKSQTVWRVKNRFDYPADFEKIREFILKIRDLKVGRSFAADEESRKRLSLLPPDAEGADAENRGTRAVLKKSDGTAVADIIIGSAREASSGNGGQYLMPADGKTVYLVDQEFRFLDLEPKEWIDPNLLDAAAADVRRVACLDPATGEEIYRLERPEKGQPPVFVAPDPADRKVVTSKITNLFSALDNLTIEDVANPEATDAETGLESPVCHEFWLYDGTTYTVCKGSPAPDDDNQIYLRATAGYRAPPAPEPAPEAEATEEGEGDGSADASTDAAETPGNDATDEADAPETAETETAPKEAGPDPAQVAAEAAARNEALSNWTFVVPKWKAARLETDLEEFFEKPEPEQPAATEAATPESAGGGS